MRDKNFNDYKNKKIAEGKHYFVALSHTSKKLIRVIYYLLKTNNSYQERYKSAQVCIHAEARQIP